VCTLFAYSGMYVVAMAGLTVGVLVILAIVFFVMKRA